MNANESKDEEAAGGFRSQADGGDDVSPSQQQTSSPLPGDGDNSLSVADSGAGVEKFRDGEWAAGGQGAAGAEDGEGRPTMIAEDEKG